MEEEIKNMSKEELLEYLEDISQQLDNIALDQIQFAISELQFFKEEYKKLEEDNKKIKNSNDTLKGFVSSIFNDTFEKDFIPTSVIQKYKEKFLEDSKNEKVFMTQSTQTNASLISFCDELLEERNK